MVPLRLRLSPRPLAELRFLPTEFVLPVVRYDDAGSAALKYVLDQFEQAPLTRLAPDHDDYILAQVP